MVGTTSVRCAKRLENEVLQRSFRQGEMQLSGVNLSCPTETGTLSESKRLGVVVGGWRLGSTKPAVASQALKPRTQPETTESLYAGLGDALMLLVLYSIGQKRYAVDLCARVRDLRRHFGGIEHPRADPRPCHDLLRRVHRIGCANSIQGVLARVFGPRSQPWLPRAVARGL